MKKRVQIEDIQPLKESFKIPEGYLDSLSARIETKKDEKDAFIRVNDITALKDSFEIPEGYFDGLMEKIEERKVTEENVVSFRSRRIKIWGAFVAVACIAMVVVSVINFGPETTITPPKTADSGLKNISDAEIATLLNERDDEFELTDDEIIEVIEHETLKDESTAIINFLQDEHDLDGTDETDFLDEI